MNIFIDAFRFKNIEVTTKESEERIFVDRGITVDYTIYFGYRNVDPISGSIDIDVDTDLNDRQAIKEKIRDMIYTESSPRS